MTTSPIALLKPAWSCRADSLRTNPSSAITVVTRSRVSALTRCGLFSTFETVPTETPAAAATSVIRGVAAMIFLASAGGEPEGAVSHRGRLVGRGFAQPRLWTRSYREMKRFILNRFGALAARRGRTALRQSRRAV